jgi:sporulation protein YlmC with PRC-barrel domain
VLDSGNDGDNPYAAMEGYSVYDASGAEVGRVQDTIYDAPSDVLKYLVVAGRPIPAELVEVDPDAERISLPFDREIVETAPKMQHLSGKFDAAVHEHYGIQT